MRIDSLVERPRLLGILGGMGPLASSHFLDCIYRLAAVRGVPEQALPRCVVLSDPSVPDRTTLIDQGRLDEGAAWLTGGLDRLSRMGADRSVVACVTAHAFVPLLPPQVRERLISLVDVIQAGLESEDADRLLVLCTSGTVRSGILTPILEGPDGSRLQIPAARDLARVHSLLYELKRGADRREMAAVVASLVRDAGADGLVAACTEAHLMTDELSGLGLVVVDPLMALATELARAGN